ncbi:hypothetical protein IMZ48_45615 [Candidatus Bathyarchaeota archaeon]|nr:hypothetical protein [Candidatus Bathyarchaeota archaeon]
MFQPPWSSYLLRPRPGAPLTTEKPSAVAHRLRVDTSPRSAPGTPAGKPQSDDPTSPSLQRYLVNPASHEMLALGLPASTPLLASTTPPQRPKESSSPGPGQPAIPSHPAAARDQHLHPSPYLDRPLSPDPSISLSPSPPACPSPEDGAEMLLELRGVGETFGKCVSPLP